MPPAVPSYPGSPADRDRWVVARREGIPRDPGLHQFGHGGWNVEEEPSASGVPEKGVTVFITNRECPWRCLMCDLWRHALETTVPPGAVPAQVADALAAAAAADDPAGWRWTKLYNAGSFFDRGAIPAADLPAIAALCRPFGRVVVECHPSLVGPRVTAFRALLHPGCRLEVAMGLETAHPAVLERLNKRVTLDGFARATAWLKAEGCDVRAFVLVRPPFMDEDEALEWAVRSTAFAFDAGVDTVALIPVRGGNGSLEALAAAGQFSPPSIATLETALARGLALRRGRVLVDPWDLGRLVSAAPDGGAIAARILRLNREQGLAGPAGTPSVAA